jgi:acetylornithine/succinyldiaminopimelate/putrescine aminotransferase
MKPVKLSLFQMLGNDYMEAVIAGCNAFTGTDRAQLEQLAREEVEFMPESFINQMDAMLDKVGVQVIPKLENSVEGAPTDAFRKASNLHASPVGGFGYLRLGEDGRIYLSTKSEHYHTPLGHYFPGYRLLQHASRLGITNATHNNTRGYITRLLERELVRTVNGLKPGDSRSLDNVLASRQPRVLNRVINLETGSLACEAGMKMMLARFYRLENAFPAPKYSGRIPVFLVMGDNESGSKANYHGTTFIAQTLRDMWPEMYEKMSEAGILKVCPVRINQIEDFKAKFAQYNQPPYKVAGFIHEIILMNYGGIKLEKSFLQQAYQLCHENDTPIMCDEIQSCMWYPDMYLFREYGLNPDFVVIGKGFPGGQYPASRIITTAEMDVLNQFGALVTNGQEELASLAYLITMKFSEENASYIREMGHYYENRLATLKSRYPQLIREIEGKGHLSSIFFHDAEKVAGFTGILNQQCIDISAQTYKANCPPAALIKPPTIATKKMIDYFLEKMDNALRSIC